MSSAVSNSPADGRIAQQIAQRLFAGQGVEEFLIFQGGGKQAPAALPRSRFPWRIRPTVF